MPGQNVKLAVSRRGVRLAVLRDAGLGSAAKAKSRAAPAMNPNAAFDQGIASLKRGVRD